MATRELLAVPIASSSRVDINSGVARMSGVIWATHWFDPAERADTVVLIVHPASNFMGHYMLAALADAGVSAVGLATRYAGNDQMLLMENCVLDVGAAIRHLKEELGYARVVLVGNSGGGGLAALFQSQAEHPTITATPAGDPPDLTTAGLLPADRLVLLMAHPGRCVVYTESLDPALRDEAEPFDRDPALDMFDPRNGPPYSPEFIAEYRQAQIDRNRRITAWVRRRLDELTAPTGPARLPHGTDPLDVVDDLPFLVHATSADPRSLDPALEDRGPQAGAVGTTIWGRPWKTNYSPVALGHATSLRSWLSQWSYDESRANAFRELPHVGVPVMVIYGSADAAAFPSHAVQMHDAIAHEHKELVRLEGASHYFTDQPDKFAEAVGHVVRFAQYASVGV